MKLVYTCVMIVGFTMAGRCVLLGGNAGEPVGQFLSMEENAWEKKVFDKEGTGVKADCSFTFEQDVKQGACIVVGPWRAGQWYARVDYRKNMPTVRGTIRGFYRTEKIGPYEAVVWTWFYQKGKRLTNRMHYLAPAPDWTPFEIPVRIAVPGADSFRPAVGVVAQGAGRIFVSGMNFSSDMAPPDFSDELPKVTRPSPPNDFKKGDFFRVEQRQGVWWLVTPEGEGFYSAGVDGPEFPKGAEGLKTGRLLAGELRDMGFNSLAGWTNPWRWGPLNDVFEQEGIKTLPLFRGVAVEPDGGQCDLLVDAYGHKTGSGGHAAPDPFDPRFEPAFRAAVRDGLENIKGKSWMAAWFTGGEISHANLPGHVWSANCATAFRNYLEARYPDITLLNAAWKKDFASFDEFAVKKPDPMRQQGKMVDDFHDFSREIVKRYIDIAIRVIREEDPGHLVFSQKFMLDDAADWIPYLDLYKAYDGIALDIYPANSVPGLDASELAILNLIHEKTGKPIIIGEWSVPARDSGLYNEAGKLDWSWSQVVETQQQRARQAARLTVDFYNLPFVVGAHWFIWGDIDSPERRANRGLFKAGGRWGGKMGGAPWQELQDAIGKANRITVGR